MSSISVVIPAFNESDSIERVLSGLRAALADISACEIIVVDDGSTDGTADLVKAPVKLVRHPVNRGHGAAMKSALKVATGDVIVVFDADGQHDASDVRRLLAEIDKGNDLVVGSRNALWRQHNGRGNVMVSTLASLLSGITVPDLTSGLRAIRRDAALEFVPYYPERFCFELTTTMACALTKRKVAFIDIVPHTRTSGYSKIRAFRDGLKFCYLMMRITYFLRPQRLIALSAVFWLAVIVVFLLTGYLHGR